MPAMIEKPLVSIVMPAYNSACFIREALDSCLQQTYSHIEILVIDDGSTDNTAAIVESYGRAVRLIQQPNKGPAIARNKGIEHARGRFIKFCDADDILYPNHIEVVLNTFARHPDAGLVYTRYLPVLKDGHTPQQDVTHPPLLSGDIYCELLLSNSNLIRTSGVTVRQQCLFHVGLFPDDESFRHAEDWDLFLRVAAEYDCIAVPDVLLNYRLHDSNISGNKLANTRGRLQVWKRARSQPKRQECFSQAEFNRHLANRYHAYAMESWAADNLPQARDALETAIHMSRRSRRLRQVYLLLSYLFPWSVVRYLGRFLRRWRGT
jgi:glycosyltransferase involved in cell wall biosynthesis